MPISVGADSVASMSTSIDLGRPVSGDVIDLILDDHRLLCWEVGLFLIHLAADPTPRGTFDPRRRAETLQLTELARLAELFSAVRKPAVL